MIPRGDFKDINGWTSGNFSLRGQDTNRKGFLQVREICWETLHEYFYFYSFNTDNRDITKSVMNNLR